jgi:ABC-2 type transport system permease protein
MVMELKKYIITAQTSLRGKINGGIVYMLPQIIFKVIYLVPLMFLWRVISSGSDADVGMSLTQLLSYTYVNALFADLLNVQSFMTAWDYDGKSEGIFTRPFSVYGYVISRTAGEWIPSLIMFSLPMVLIAPLFGISVIPATLWFFPSLLLCVSLGFAFEFLFFCVTLRLRNISWLTMVFRQALMAFFSGTAVPFKILPFGLDRWISYQPFASLGGAPLSLFTAAAHPSQILPVQIFWNITIWAAAVIWFKKSRERMVSFGG